MKPLHTMIGLLLTLAFYPLFSWAGGEVPSPEQGEMRPGYYRNDYFGFSLRFPQNWNVVVQRRPHEFQAAGGDALIRDGVLSREQVRADQNNTHNLLKIGDPSDESNGRNPTIVIVAEGMHEGAPFKTGEGYLANTLRLEAAKRSPEFWATGLPREVSLGERKFYRAELHGEQDGKAVLILYYAEVIKDFAVSIIVTAGDAEQLARADRILKEVHFNSSK